MASDGATRPGVIFDLDGTLADTLDDITDTINAVFEGAGRSPVDQQRVRALIGEGLTNLLHLASSIEDAEALTSLVERYGALYHDRLLTKTRLYPGVSALLDELTRRRIPVAVLSNKPEEFTVPICDALLAPWPFVSCRGACDEARRKPDPTVALELARSMDRAAPAIFFVGDSTVDVQTAHNAGMVSVAVTWGYRDATELHAAGPKHCIDSPDELLGLLSGCPG